MGTPFNESDAREMIADLEQPRKVLSHWEAQFIESISDQLDQDSYLTDPQRTTLTKIHEEKA